MITDEMLHRASETYLVARHNQVSHHDAMRAAIEAARAWRPIETAPKDKKLIVWNGYFISMGVLWPGGWIDLLAGAFADNPTHWMPLPAPPAAHQDTTKEGQCSSCDGTGDVHRADGEYLGPCQCKSQEGAVDEVARTLRPIETAPKDGLILLAVAEQNNPKIKQTFVAEMSIESGDQWWMITTGWTGFERLHSAWEPIGWRPIPAGDQSS